jgi:hypothetical protein
MLVRRLPLAYTPKPGRRTHDESLSLPYSCVRSQSFVPTRFARLNRKSEDGGRESSWSVTGLYLNRDPRCFFRVTGRHRLAQIGRE